jgi:hypothetical protein
MAEVATVTDFAHVSDTIQLNRSVFTGLGGDGTLAAGYFHVVTTPPGAGSGICYDSANGYLYRGGIHFASLATHLTVDNSDFVLVG